MNARIEGGRLCRYIWPTDNTNQIFLQEAWWFSIGIPALIDREESQRQHMLAWARCEPKESPRPPPIPWGSPGFRKFSPLQPTICECSHATAQRRNERGRVETPFFVRRCVVP